MIYSLKVQTSKHWKLHIVVDGNLDLFNKLEPYKNNQIKISYIQGPNNDWGHTAREFGKKVCVEEWIVMSGDDNYYVPTFIEEFLKAANSSSIVDFVYCDMIHNSFNYQTFISSPSAGQIDIGNFMMKTRIAQQFALGKSYGADGEFVEAYKAKMGTKGIIKVPKILYVHN